jgi:hypothetical protein
VGGDERRAWALESFNAVPSYFERHARTREREKQAVAQVTEFYPGYDPEQIETQLREYLANGENNRALVVQYREALAQMD